MSLAQHILSSFDVVEYCVNAYLADLSDQELLVRPAPECNHIAWQLGHLICSEAEHRQQIFPHAELQLPSGFTEKHTRQTASLDDPEAFCSKQEYLHAMAEQRRITKSLLTSLTDQELMAPAPAALTYFGNTVGCVFSGETVHWMMHTGQWVVIRRLLGKPPLF